ncbi:MAG: type II toxin-antitoxin system Phd/YefM family antitoxin [Terriglobia bacterium]
MSRSVGIFEAKTHLSALVDRVERGEEITITKHGAPAAVLIPASKRRRKDPKEVGIELRAMRKGVRLGGLSLRELIEEGRRF